MYEVLLSILILIFTILAWHNLRLAIFVIAIILPAYLLRFSILAVPTTALEIMILIVFLITLIKHGKELLSLPLGKWRTLISLILIATIVAVLIPTDHVSALGIWKAYFLEPILFFGVIATVLKSEQDRLKLVMALGAGALFVSVFAIFQTITGLALPIPWDIEHRATSIFPFPNSVGLYLGPIIVISSLMFVRTWSIKSKLIEKTTLFWLSVSLIGFIGIITAQSEAAIGAVITTLFIAAMFWKKSRNIAILITTISFFIVLLIPQIRTPLFDKITLQDYSGSIRIMQWKETKLFLIDHPLQGAGLNGYPAAITPYHTHPEIEVFQYPHNIFLNFWVELGVFGLVALAWLITIVSISIPKISNLPKRIPLGNWLGIVSGFALLEMIIHGIVDVPYLKNDLAILSWILLALIFLSHVSKKLHSRSSKTR